MAKTLLRIKEVQALMSRFREINQLDIDEIELIDDNGNVVEIAKDIIEDWKFTGLNITDFIDSSFYKTGFDKQNISTKENMIAKDWIRK